MEYGIRWMGWLVEISDWIALNICCLYYAPVYRVVTADVDDGITLVGHNPVSVASMM